MSDTDQTPGAPEDATIERVKQAIRDAITKTAPLRGVPDDEYGDASYEFDHFLRRYCDITARAALAALPGAGTLEALLDQTNRACIVITKHAPARDGSPVKYAIRAMLHDNEPSLYGEGDALEAAIRQAQEGTGNG